MYIEVRKIHVFVLSFLFVLVGVVAYGSTSAPSAFGHSSGEVDVTIGGVTKTLQQAITDGSLGSGGGVIPVATGARLLVKNVSFAVGSYPHYPHATCLLLTDGQVACAGYTNFNKVGLGVTGLSVQPIFHTLPLMNVTSLVGGAYGFCAIYDKSGTERNRLVCWGHSAQGQTGTGSRDTSISIPTTVALAAGDQVAKVVCKHGDYEHTCALLTSGTLKCWGYNGYGQLGDGTTTDRATPVSVGSLTGLTDFDLGGHSSGGMTCAKKTASGLDTLYCWGYNGYGQLGQNSADGSAHSTPLQVAGLTNVRIKQFDVAESDYGEVCVVLGGVDDGKIKCWGYNGYGQLGDGTTTDRTGPTFVQSIGSSLPKAVRVQIGAELTSDLSVCALLEDGTLACWGENNYGQLGDGTTTIRKAPVRVLDGATNLPLTGITDFVVGTHWGISTVCALQNTGNVYCWGYNGIGQVGNGYQNSPVMKASRVLGVSGATGLYGASWYSRGTFCALLRDNTLKCWGDNTYGQMGTGNAGAYHPTAVSPL